MKPTVTYGNGPARSISFGFLLAFAFLALAHGYARAQDRAAPELADQYRERVEERRSEIRSEQQDVQRIDDTIRALRKEMAADGRRGRIKDLRSRIDQLNERKEGLKKKTDTERQAVSGATEPDEAYRRVSAGDLIEQQKLRTETIRDLDGQIAALKRQLVEKGGRRGRKSNLQRQIEELSGKRDELASRPRIDPEDVTDAAAVEDALARRFKEAEARRENELKRVRAQIDAMQERLAKEGRRVRRQSIEAMISELKLREHEFKVAPARPGDDEAEGESRRAIERGIKRERAHQDLRAEILDQKIKRLRGQLRVEGRGARRRSIDLQIQELERQKSGKSQRAFEPPPKKGFTGAPYGSAWDLDAEYKPPATSE